MKTKLEKELIKSSLNSNDNAEKVLQSALLLLESNQQEERAVLKKIGLDNEIRYFENQNNSFKLKKELSDKYQVPVVSKEELENFCKKYALIIRNPKDYLGKLPTDIGVSVNNFVKNNNIVLGEGYDRGSGFLIVAPCKMFGIKDSIDSLLTETIDVTKDSTKSFINSFKDPILIYALPENNYAIVKSWGKDETIKRRISGFYFKYLERIVSNVLPRLIVFSMLFIIFYILHLTIGYFNDGKYGFFHKDYGNGRNFLDIILCVLYIISNLILFITSLQNDMFSKISRSLKNRNPIYSIWS